MDYPFSVLGNRLAVMSLIWRSIISIWWEHRYFVGWYTLVVGLLGCVLVQSLVIYSGMLDSFAFVDQLVLIWLSTVIKSGEFSLCVDIYF